MKNLSQEEIDIKTHKLQLIQEVSAVIQHADTLVAEILACNINNIKEFSNELAPVRNFIKERNDLLRKLVNDFRELEKKERF